MFRDTTAVSAATTRWASYQTQWTRDHDMVFEQALVMVPEGVQNRWEKIAEKLPGKSAVEVRDHYEALVHDLREIESGRVDVPSYSDEWDSSNQISFESKVKRRGDNQRKKGKPWSTEEHGLFLIGLGKYGKGDWVSISRNCVKTRTPTQVASHAQKYFIRQKSVKKVRKRSSIHDITYVDSNSAPTPIDQNWVPPPGEEC